jgi:8-oxo-dGTP pyrophosphatase MutT (NUDIX family)
VSAETDQREGATEEEAPTLRDAATILVLRDGDEGPEVFMVRRTSKASFMPNAWVYPGGALDEEDASASAARSVEGFDAEAAVAELGEEIAPERALGLYLAGVRETFEESGLLLARRRGEEGFVDLTGDAGVARRFSQQRQMLRKGSLSLSELAEYERLVIPLDRVSYWTRWVTPYVEPKRFDARFFVVRAPENQEPLHDDQETVNSGWTTPRAAIDAYEAGELLLTPPTLATLTELTAFGSVDTIMAAAPTRPRTINLPHFEPGEDGAMALILPGDPDYPADDPLFPAGSPAGTITRMVLGEDRIWRIVG